MWKIVVVRNMSSNYNNNAQFLLNLYMRRRLMQRMGIRGGVRGVFSSMSAPMSEDNSLKYYCMSCGTQHKDISCPNCGSKMKKVGY